MSDRGGSPDAPATSQAADGPAPAPPGWYPDPWTLGQRRFWTGEAWTAEIVVDAPAGLARSPWAPPASDEAGPDHAGVAESGSQWGVAASPAEVWPWSPGQLGAGGWESPASAQVSYPTNEYPDVARQPPGSTEPPGSKRLVPFLALVVGLIVGFVVVVAVVSAVVSRSRSTSATAPTGPGIFAPPRTPRTTPADPSASVLAGLVVTRADVASTADVQPIPGGTQVEGQPTLDLCNGTFPSEALRAARLQVAELDAQGVALSTEAVLYASPSGTAQAFAELRATAARCPSTAVPSPVGQPAVTTRFNAPPDGAWAQTPTVERVAFDFVTTDAAGQSRHSIGVYLRRGRVLMGVYFARPDGAQPAVAGQTSVAGIVNVFATRLAQLPASVVNGGTIR